MEIYNDNSNYLTGYIYCITNKVNGMQYVGQTIRAIIQRWYCHKAESKNIVDKMYFHSAIRKYGADNFDVEAGKENNIGSSRVSQCCNGERTNSKGFQYRQYTYKKDILEKIDPIKLKFGKKIIQYSIDGDTLNEFETTNEIKKIYPDFELKTIRSCCTKGRKTAYGYIWKYAEVV